MIAVIEPTSPSGMASLRLASPARSVPGPAASAPERARRRPAPRTKSTWKGKKPPTMGTKRTPPPMPPTTATMPSRNDVAKSSIGQPHHGMALATSIDPDLGRDRLDRIRAGEALAREGHEIAHEARVDPFPGVDHAEVADER